MSACEWKQNRPKMESRMTCAVSFWLRYYTNVVYLCHLVGSPHGAAAFNGFILEWMMLENGQVTYAGLERVKKKALDTGCGA